VTSQLATVVTLNQLVKTFADIVGSLPVGQGGTWATTAAVARKNHGLLPVADSASKLAMDKL
jgi:hypothetical protein